jgi:hypothetical protein
MFEAASPKGESAEFCEHGVQGRNRQDSHGRAEPLVKKITDDHFFFPSFLKNTAYLIN